MSIGKICTRTVIVIDRNESATEAAKLMRQHHVGDLVVVNERDEVRKPLGVVTDRDIVVSVVALGVVPEKITVGDIMSSKAHVAREDEDELEVAERMRGLGVRRVPVVDTRGALVGIIAMDDLLEHLSEGLDSIAHIHERQREHEASARR
ncbi:MAG: CBS domain-containing protein [Gammaproteobacteria bacterium]|nr:CBS domain-containing protein [Gammaproteobacteria bacterium]MDE2345125.1 CBS domain-containing protein [Gammaproteobacteria bacterium]